MNFFGEIIYTEGYQNTYKGISLKEPNSKREYLFMNGDPCVDLIDVYHFISSRNMGLLWSSNYDHFLSDGNKWTWCRWDINTNELYFNTKEIFKKYNFENYHVNTTEYIIPNNDSIETLDDLKKYYDSQKTLKV